MAASRITIPHLDEAPASSKEVLNGIQKRLGSVPNVFRLLSISPKTIRAFAGVEGALGDALDAKTRYGIALAVSEANACNYCLAAHSAVAKKTGVLTDEEIENARKGFASDFKSGAAIAFAKQVIEKRGKVSEAEFEAVRTAGFTDPEILEIIGLAVQFLFTNYVNNVVKTDIDFPVINIDPD
jgi:uncharacterized peroxidase-related enzyme